GAPVGPEMALERGGGLQVPSCRAGPARRPAERAPRPGTPPVAHLDGPGPLPQLERRGEVEPGAGEGAQQHGAPPAAGLDLEPTRPALVHRPAVRGEELRDQSGDGAHVAADREDRAAGRVGAHRAAAVPPALPALSAPRPSPSGRSSAFARCGTSRCSWGSRPAPTASAICSTSPWATSTTGASRAS